jgi:pentafunctional AROM polypeptide
MGVHGQLSRVLNETFSPVTHPNLPAAAAPGQMSVAEVHRTLTLLGQLPSRSFYLLGSPIAHSMSPTLHNTAFGALGLPHQYGLLETADAEDALIASTLHNPAFGGASVTIPLKEVVGQYLQELSPAAKAIGAVNTIIVQNQVGENGQRTLRGENTDWAGIAACVRARMPAGTNIDVGFVIGAGGTARAAVYALFSLGAETVYIYNRTQARAEAVRDAFPNANVVVIDELTAWPAGAASPSVIIGTVPAPAQDALALPTLSDALLAAPHGVVVDMAYKPATTPLVAVAEAKEGWAAVRGIEVLLEQGYEQLWHWTGRRVPREKIKVAVMEGYERS